MYISNNSASRFHSHAHSKHKKKQFTKKIFENFVARNAALLSDFCRLPTSVWRLMSVVCTVAKYVRTHIHTHTQTHTQYTHKYIRFILRYFSKFSCGFLAVVYRSRSLFMRYICIYTNIYSCLHGQILKCNFPPCFCSVFHNHFY